MSALSIAIKKRTSRQLFFWSMLALIVSDRSDDFCPADSSAELIYYG